MKQIAHTWETVSTYWETSMLLSWLQDWMTMSIIFKVIYYIVIPISTKDISQDMLHDYIRQLSIVSCPNMNSRISSSYNLQYFIWLKDFQPDFVNDTNIRYYSPFSASTWFPVNYNHIHIVTVRQMQLSNKNSTFYVYILF